MHRLVLMCLFVLACGNDGVELRVDLKTDMVSAFEFQTIDLELHSQPPRRLGEEEPYMLDRFRLDFFAPDPELGRGKTLYTFDVDTLKGGAPYYLRARFFGSNGAWVAEQVTAVLLDGQRTAATMLVTRDCTGVMCPAVGGDANALACLRGTCVDPRCPQDRSFCPMPECTDDTDCADFTPPVACGARACVEGYCLALDESTACPDDQWCNPDFGCTRGLAMDAGACFDGERCVPANECETGVVTCSPVRVCLADGLANDTTACAGGTSTCDGMGRCL